MFFWFSTSFLRPVCDFGSAQLPKRVRTVTLCDADLGKFVNPEITMGFALDVILSSTAEQFDQHKTELLAWQKKEKREEDFIPWDLGWGF